MSDINAEILDNVDIAAVITLQKRSLLNMSEHSKQQIASRYAKQYWLYRLSKMYDLEGVEELLDDPRCGKCGKEATQRCSLCKNEWYCGYVICYALICIIDGSAKSKHGQATRKYANCFVLQNNVETLSNTTKRISSQRCLI